MDFENNKQAVPQNQPISNIEVANRETAQKVENFVRLQIHELFERTLKEPNKKRFIVDQITTLGRKVFQGKERLLDAALAKIEATPYTTDEEFEENTVKELTNAVVAFVVSSGFSEQEARTYFRSVMQEGDEVIPLDKDKVFSYSRFQDNIDLHITKGFTPQLFLGAMLALAPVVQGDESIKTVKMTSWIVAKHPKVIRRYGFTVNDALDEGELVEIRSHLSSEIRDKPIAEAYMTRQDFLAKWGGERNG